MPQWWESAPVVGQPQQAPQQRQPAQSGDWWQSAPVVNQAQPRQANSRPQAQQPAPSMSADDAWMYEEEQRDPNDLRGLMKPEFAAQQAEQQPVEVVIDEGVMNVNGRAMLGDRDLGPWRDYWTKMGRADELSPGYQTALEQEADLAKRLQQAGQGVSFTDQLTSPFNDELAGVAGYLRQGVGNIGRQLTGREIEVSAMDRARAAADVARGQQADFARENPLQTAAGNVLGGFAFAPGRAAGLAGGAAQFLRPTMAQAYGGAAATGGLYGMADAEGGLSDRLQGGAFGAVLGGATAGVLDAAGAGISAFRPRAWNAQALTPEQSRIGGLFDRELRRSGMSRADLEAAINAAPEGALPLNANQGFLAPYAEALAQSPGPGNRIVRDALAEQQRGTSSRFRSRVGETMGGEGNYFATLDNAIQIRRNDAEKVIREIGPQTYRPNENAINALRSPYARQALERQVALRAGSPDPLKRAEAETLRPVLEALGRDVVPDITLDIATSQAVSRAMLDASSDAWRNADGGLGGLLGDIGKAVRNDARDQVKAYDGWLNKYGDDSDNIQALELGRQIFRQADDARPDGMSAEVLRKQFNELSDTGKDLFRKGVGEAIVARAQTTRGDLGAMRDVIRSGEFADRIRIAFPDEQAFTRFLNAAENEVQMANTANSIMNGSPTYRRQAVAQDLGAQAYGDQAASSLQSASIPGLAIQGARQAVRGIGNAIGRNRSILQNDRLNETLGRALTEPEILRQLLNRPARRGLFGGRAPVGVAGSAPQAIHGF